ARHRDFAKSYQVQHNVVRNPRCPVDVATALIARINDRDMKLLLKNRNVSDAVRRQARRLLDAREARRRVRVGVKRH
ncbi:MAG: hypothetical protein JSV80_05210, partial [Acidobacteriota bacterium]